MTTTSEYRKAIYTLSEAIVKDFGGDRYWPYYHNWYDRQVDRVVEYLMGDDFNNLVDSVVEEYDEAVERMFAADEEADQALELRREP